MGTWYRVGPPTGTTRPAHYRQIRCILAPVAAFVEQALLTRQQRQQRQSALDGQIAPRPGDRYLPAQERLVDANRLRGSAVEGLQVGGNGSSVSAHGRAGQRRGDPDRAGVLEAALQERSVQIEGRGLAEPNVAPSSTIVSISATKPPAASTAAAW